MKIKEVMSKAIAVNRDVSLKEAAKIMSGRNIGSLVIVNGNDIVGIITERDILRNASKLDSKISKAMNKNIVTINQNADIDEAAALMAKHKIRRLPVFDDKCKLVGIITATDIIAHAEDIGDEFWFD